MVREGKASCSVARNHSQEELLKFGGATRTSSCLLEMEGPEVSKYFPENFEDVSKARGKAVLQDCHYEKGKTQTEELSRSPGRSIPEDLVVTILAMVPFPFLFKARVLSKSWLKRFSSISSLDNEEEKQLAISFQKQVCERSSNYWMFTKCKTFWPVIASTNGDLIAYDREVRTWQRLPSLPFRPKIPLKCASDLIIEGCLVLVVAASTLQEPTFFVANISNESWEAYVDFWAIPKTKSLPDMSLDMYEVILVGLGQTGKSSVGFYPHLLTQISSFPLPFEFRSSPRNSHLMNFVLPLPSRFELLRPEFRSDSPTLPTGTSPSVPFPSFFLPQELPSHACLPSSHVPWISPPETESDHDNQSNDVISQNFLNFFLVSCPLDFSSPDFARVAASFERFVSGIDELHTAEGMFVK